MNNLVQPSDIVDVAHSLGVTLTDAEINWVLLCYEDAQRQDPSGTWNLVVEDLIYQAEEIRKQEEADEESEETRRDFGNDDLKMSKENSMPAEKNYKVVFEIDITSTSELNAAKQAQSWLQKNDCNWQFYVQEQGKNKTIFSVDLAEEDENAVSPVADGEYSPMIVPNK